MLAGVHQPLAGEVAARRSLLEQLPFMTGYGVEIAMLLDVLELAGLERIAQVDLDVHRNSHQPLLELSAMAYALLRVLATRLEREGRLLELDALAAAARRVARFDLPRARAPADGQRTMNGALYVDLDGTLLGRGASLLHDGDGAISLLGVRAVEACLRADVEVVIMSGRRRAQVAEDARLLGQSSFIYEAGCVLVLDGETLWMTELVAGERTVHEQIEDSGAPALLLERYAGRLEYHDPWHENREISHLFRGHVDADEADALLAEHGFGHLRLVDNGVLRHTSQTLAHLDRLSCYHLIPAGGSKAGAVARHMRARGLRRQDTFAVGDSREDLAVASVVGTFWLVANALERDPTLREATCGAHANVRVTAAGHGAGVYEAVVTTLAERR